jgi:glycine/D-amino acid oxidase-like deaminating enzyme/nitrite reductase/ring-hydroxylating ferredoxin subunit
MKRDGSLNSLWQNKMPEYVSLTRGFSGKTYDVVIAGGGVTGIATALMLQKSGKSVLVAEAQNLCFGTTGGTTAHLNNFFDTSYDQVKSGFGEDDAQLLAIAANKALDLYKSNIETYGIDCGYTQKDAYLFAKDQSQADELEKIYKAAKNVGIDVSYTDRIPVPEEFLKAIVFHEQAQVHPARYVYGLAKAFEEAGGEIIQNCRILKFSGDEILEIETTQGQCRTSNLIWATHIPPGINLLHFRCAPYRSYAMAVILNDESYPEGLAYDLYDPYHYYRTQEIDGKNYLIAGGEDHKTGHEEHTEGCFKKLEAHVRSVFDVKEIAFRWSSQYFEPADGLAYIGHLPGNPSNVFVATGFGGNGMTYSHIAANLLTEKIENKDSDLARLLNPGRIKPVAGFANFVKENADVVAQFIGKKFSAEKIEELADLAPGEARVVKYEGSKLAIYKDESGNVHAINPTCTHAKCTVGWNDAEKSWDCPCHGARYSMDGEVLTGPASKALELVSLPELVRDKSGD